MSTAIPFSIPRPRVARRVAVLSLVVMTADQVARAVALRVAEGNPSAAVSARTSRLGLGVFDPTLPMVALLAAIGIVAVGLVGLRRFQAGLLPAWVPGFLIGGAASTVLDRLAGGAVAGRLAAPWSFCTAANVAIVCGIVGWVITDCNLARASAASGSASHPRC